MDEGLPVDFPKHESVDTRFLKVHCIIRLEEISTEFAMIMNRKSKVALERKAQLYAIFHENIVLLNKLKFDLNVMQVSTISVRTGNHTPSQQKVKKAYVVLYRTSRHYSGHLEKVKIKKGKEWWRTFRLFTRQEFDP